MCLSFVARKKVKGVSKEQERQKKQEELEKRLQVQLTLFPLLP